MKINRQYMILALILIIILMPSALGQEIKTYSQGNSSLSVNYKLSEIAGKTYTPYCDGNDGYCHLPVEIWYEGDTAAKSIIDRNSLVYSYIGLSGEGCVRKIWIETNNSKNEMGDFSSISSEKGKHIFIDIVGDLNSNCRIDVIPKLILNKQEFEFKELATWETKDLEYEWINGTCGGDPTTNGNLAVDENWSTFANLGANSCAFIYENFTYSNTISSANISSVYRLGAGVVNSTNWTYANTSYWNYTSNLWQNLKLYNMSIYDDTAYNYTTTNTSLPADGIGSKIMIRTSFSTKTGTVSGAYGESSIIYDIINATSTVSNTNPIITENVTFLLTLNSTNMESVNATLYFNKTAYYIGANGYQNTSTRANITKSIIMPIIPSSTVLQYYWNFSVNGNYAANSSLANLTLNAISLTAINCNASSIAAINFTLWDEDNRTSLTGSLNANMIIWKDDKNSNITYLMNQTGNNFTFCIYPKYANYSMDFTGGYTSEGYTTRTYYMENATLNNVTNNIYLYNLISSRATAFIITYKDSNYLPASNVLINLQRQYIASGAYELVQIGRTDSSGQTIGYFVTNDVIYNIVVTKNGVILATFPNIIAVCQTPTYAPCTININQGSSFISQRDFNSSNGISYNIDFNEDSRTITAIFSSIDNTIVTIDFNVSKFDAYGNTSICSYSQSAITGTFTCVIPSNIGNTTIIAHLYKRGSVIPIATRIYSFAIGKAREIIGSNAYILLVIMFMTIPMMFVASGVMFIYGCIIGLILASVMLIFNISNIITTSSSIIWMVITGILLIIKMNHHEN